MQGHERVTYQYLAVRRQTNRADGERRCSTTCWIYGCEDVLHARRCDPIPSDEHFDVALFERSGRALGIDSHGFTQQQFWIVLQHQFDHLDVVRTQPPWQLIRFMRALLWMIRLCTFLADEVDLHRLKERISIWLDEIEHLGIHVGGTQQSRDTQQNRIFHG